MDTAFEEQDPFDNEMVHDGDYDDPNIEDGQEDMASEEVEDNDYEGSASPEVEPKQEEEDADEDEEPQEASENGLETHDYDESGAEKIKEEEEPADNSQEDQDEEFEIDPKKLMMLEPEVDIIEEADEEEPVQPVPRQQVSQPRFHQPSILRKKVAPTRFGSFHQQHNARFYSNGLESRNDDDFCENSVDDRVGCRSLVCDSSGIIIAEMVYRCMICAFVSDSINSAQKHYKTSHMSKKAKMTTRGPKDFQPETPVANSPQDDIFDDYEEDAVDEDDDVDIGDHDGMDDSVPDQPFQSTPLTYHVPSGMKNSATETGRDESAFFDTEEAWELCPVSISAHLWYILHLLLLSNRNILKFQVGMPNLCLDPMVLGQPRLVEVMCKCVYSV